MRDADFHHQKRRVERKGLGWEKRKPPVLGNGGGQADGNIPSSEMDMT